MGHGVIVVCRMNSSRLPGKTLAPVGEYPLLWYVCSRLSSLSRSGISVCVATSNEWFDEPIAEFCKQHNLDCFRGDCHDVSGRILDCARTYGYSHFARVNGDSPFVDAELIARAFRQFEQGQVDFVTNLVPRSYPYGVAVEVMRTQWYSDWMSGFNDPEDREHVTRSIYQNIDRVQFTNLIRSGTDLSQWSLTVDTPEHLQWFRQFVAGINEDWTTFGYEAAIARIQRQRRAG